MEYKPLIELANDEQACREIFESIKWGEYRSSKTSTSIDGKITLSGVHYEGNKLDLTIYYGGNIFFTVDGADDDFGSAFALVDKIRSLGYSA